MSHLDDVALIPRMRHADERGWLLKVLNGQEPNLPAMTGEVDLASAVPGQVRGNHFHHAASEWFTVVQGQARAVLADPDTGNRRDSRLCATEPVSLFVPAGVAHAFLNPGDSGESMLLIADADPLYDPADTVRMDLA